MAKRVRETGVPVDQAHKGSELPRLRNYTGYQCGRCALRMVCDPAPPPGGPWEILEARPDEMVQCLVHSTVRMVPVRVRRLKAEPPAPPPPPPKPLDERHVLLDANALIEGAKGTFPGMIGLVLEPPPGFRYYTTDAVAKECAFLPGVDRSVVFAHITVLPTPASIDTAITETHGRGINPPSETDAGLFQLAKDDPKFTILVSHDRFHRWTGLPGTLGIAGRLRVYAVDDFIRFAKKFR